MGQKVNPIAFRLETVKNSPEWQSSWYANKKKYPIFLLEDKKIRDFIQKKLTAAGVVATRIQRSNKKIKVIIVVSRPGLVIGRGGKELETLKKELQKLISKANGKLNLEIQVEEFKHADLSAKLIAEKIALYFLMNWIFEWQKYKTPGYLINCLTMCENPCSSLEGMVRKWFLIAGGALSVRNEWAVTSSMSMSL